MKKLIAALVLLVVVIFVKFGHHPQHETVAILESSPEVVATTVTIAAATKPVEILTTSKDLTELGEQALSTLATRKALHTEGNQDFHHAPGILLQSAIDLGNYKEKMLSLLSHSKGSEQRKSILTQGLEAYRRCLENREALSTVRALCYSNWKEINAMGGQQDPAKLNVPFEVKSLAQVLDTP